MWTFAVLAKHGKMVRTEPRGAAFSATRGAHALRGATAAPRGRPFRSLHGPGIRVAGYSCSELKIEKIKWNGLSKVP